MAYIIGPKMKQTIYVIESPTLDFVYIDKSKTNQLKEAYRRHRYGRRAMTREMFDEAKINGNMPKMYLLEEVELTEREAFNHVVAWAKHFDDHGFELLCGEKFFDYVKNLNEDSMRAYEQIKSMDPFDLLVPDNELFANYGNQRRHHEDGTPAVITISVSEDEYDYVNSEADALNMSMSEFCKQLVMKGYIQKIDSDVFSDLWEFVDGFRKRNDILKEILITIYRTQRYYPMDLKIIQEQTEENSRQKIEAMKSVNEILSLLRKDVREHIDE